MIYLKLDGNTIVGHDYKLSGEYNTEVSDTVLTNSEGNYIYKYDNGLVPLSVEEVNSHPNKIANDTKSARAVKKARGRIYREKCQIVLDLINDHNEQNSLSAAQIDSQIAAHADILTALQHNRPYSARDLVNAVTPDGTLISQELKDDVMAELNELP